MARFEAALGTRNSAISAAVYMESLIAPLSQDLADGNELSREQRANLDEILARPAVREGILSVKIWKDAGLVAYASDPDLIARNSSRKAIFSPESMNSTMTNPTARARLVCPC